MSIGDLHVLLGEYDQAQAAYQAALSRIEAMRGQSQLLSTLNSQLPTLTVRLHRLLAVVQERRSDYQAAFKWLERGMAEATAELREELARCYLLGAGITSARVNIRGRWNGQTWDWRLPSGWALSAIRPKLLC